jgi:plastocyanin
LNARNLTVCLLSAVSIFFLLHSPSNAETIKGVVKNPWVAKFPIVVYIDEIPGQTFTPKNHPIMDQKNKEFIPRVLPVLVGSTVDFTNQDDMEHNVLSPDNEGYDLGNAGKGVVLSYTFKNPGVYAQLCRLHPEMVGYIVVVKTPYYTLTDEQGNFKLEDVPPGQHKLKVWGERLKVTQLRKEFFVTVEPGKEASIEIHP